MTPDRLERIKELFESALEQDSAERTSFLAQACSSDDDLRAQVVQLLAQHESACDFLEHPLAQVRDVAITSRPPRSVFAAEQVVGNRFRIVKILGQGGMGEVYEAFDLELRDCIALKTIRQDIASDSGLIERFKQEVQRSRTISHPNVCRVYDLFRERAAGDADVWFLTMELLRGETLSDLLHRMGRLETRAALPLVKQMCDALDAAHHSGVVHRDFKSGNVMLLAGPHDSEIRVVVTDFGLAKTISATGAGTSSATEAITSSLDDSVRLLGTPAYMAPEQLEGKAATAASDLYALGVVMYEMVTGVRPFVGDSALSIAVKRLTEPPKTPRAHVPELEPRWEQTILRCLERDPARRFAGAGDVSGALDGSASGLRVTAGTDIQLPRDMNEGPLEMNPQSVGHRDDGATEITSPLEARQSTPPAFAAVSRHARFLRARFLLSAVGMVLGVALLFNLFSGRALAVSSIAVVPFVSDGSDPDTQYLSDGITEGIIDSLAQLPQSTLKVIALNSMMRYKGREIDPEAIGDELSVGAVVIGRIVQRADKLSVSAELVNASDRSRMWGKTYSASLADLPVVQEEIAEAISDTLQLRLKGDEKNRLTKRSTVSVDAYRFYLQGRYFWNKYTEEGWTKAIEYFKQAIGIDPNYALAWAGLADSYYQLSSLVLLPAEAIPQARAAAAKALAIDEGVAEAHASLGMIKAQYDWDSKGAAKEFNRAIELNPNYATAHQWYGMHLFANGQFEAALVELNRAQELDPLSMFIAVTAVWPLSHLGQDDHAIRQLEKAVEMFPDVPDLIAYLHQLRGESYLKKGLNDHAVAELLNGSKMKALCGDDPETIEAVKRAYTSSGLNGYWRKQLELATRRHQQEVDSARKQSPRRYVSPFRLAELRARVGDKDLAFALLQVSYDNRDENLRWLKVESLSVDSPWQSLRSDRRFTELLRNVGLDG
jgi:serine/threonine protein kinase/tetratricopeptide (TPR) repeat protein